MITESQLVNESALNKLVEELCDQIQAGTTVELESLIEQYPHMADRLRVIYPTVMAMANWSATDSKTGASLSGLDGFANREIGDFQIVRQIGRGGMGVVYEAQQLSIHRKVALKVLPLAALVDHRALQRFKNEVAAIATLEHPHIVSVYAIGEDRGIHYYAMQLIRGQSLAAVIRELRSRTDQDKSLSGDVLNQVVSDMEDGDAIQVPSPPLRGRGQGEGVRSLSDSHLNDATAEHPQPICPSGADSEQLPETALDTRARGRSSTLRQVGDQTYFRNVVRLILQAADALQHAHDHGIVHRDVKPGNLLLDTHGSLFVTDFGLARIETAAGVTMTGDVLGTLRYMSPEQVLGNRVIIDHRTDVYSLGATLYELLTLQPIWSGDNKAELIRQISFEEPTRPKKINPSIPTDLETIVLKAISKNPNDRYDNARTFADDLSCFLDLKPINAKRPTGLQRVAKWTRRHPIAVWATMLVFVFVSLVAVTSAVLIWQESVRATRAETNANLRAQRLKSSNELLASVFEDLDIDEVRDGTEPLEAVLADRLVRAAHQLDGTTLGDELVVAELQFKLANALTSLGFADRALPLYESSWASRKTLLGLDSREALSSMIGIGRSLLNLKKFPRHCRIWRKQLSDVVGCLAQKTKQRWNPHECSLLVFPWPVKQASPFHFLIPS